MLARLALACLLVATPLLAYQQQEPQEGKLPKVPKDSLLATVAPIWLLLHYLVY